MLLVVSAPSGAGKTTLCDRLLEQDAGIRYSISCTTRLPREGETDGVHYRFLREEEFDQHLENDRFLEYADVHGCRYGTLEESVAEELQNGCDVLLDIDVQGAEKIRQALRRRNFCLGNKPVNYADIFITPPSMDELEARLRGRGKDAEDVIQRRLANAAGEIKHWRAYRYLVRNRDIDDAYRDLYSILHAERCRIHDSNNGS